MRYKYLDGNIHIGKAKKTILSSMANGCLRDDTNLIKHFCNVILSRVGVRLKPDVTLDEVFDYLEFSGIIRKVEEDNESLTMI